MGPRHYELYYEGEVLYKNNSSLQPEDLMIDKETVKIRNIIGRNVESITYISIEYDDEIRCRGKLYSINRY